MIKALFSTIKYGLDLAPNPPIIPDQSALIKLARQQSILSIIFRAFAKAGIKNEELSLLCYQDAFYYVNRNYSLRQIYGVLESTGIPFIPLKGSVLRFLYPEPWMRTSSDIDVLIHEEDLDRAVKALEDKAELKFDHRAYHDVAMHGSVVTLELHFSLKEAMDNIDKILDHVWEYSSPVSGFHYSMTPEFLIFHNIAHMSYHFSHGGLGIRPYIDLYLLRKKTEYDEGKLREMLRDCGIERFYDCCCRLLDVWFEDKDHDEVTERMEQFCFEGGVFGNAANSMAAKKRKHSGMSYYLHRLFEDRKSLEQMYPILQEKPGLLFFYQMKRWRKGLTSSRKRVARELKLMKGTDDKTVKTYDALMKSVGL